MTKLLRDDIDNIIKKNNFKFENISKTNLITLCLSEIFQKKYFNNSYKNSFIVRDPENNLWLTTGNMNDLGTYGIPNIISSPHKDLDFDSQFVWSDKNEILINKDNFLVIKNIYQAFKNGKNLNDTVNKIQKICDSDNESIFIFESYLKNYLSFNELYEKTIENLKLKNNSSKNYKNLIRTVNHPEKKFNFMFKKIKNLDNFDILKDSLIDILNKELKYFKNIEPLLSINEKYISAIIKEIDTIHPELNFNPVNKELEFYLIESPVQSTSYNTPELYYINNERETIKNKNSLNSKNSELNFKNFIYENTFSFSQYNQSNVNKIEGLEYITDDLLKRNMYSDNLFLIAKTNKNETVGVISLSKDNEFEKSLKIVGICVKNSYRNQHVAKDLYRKLAEISIDNNLIIYSGSYTQKGRSRLPKIKMEVMMEYPKFMMLDDNLYGTIKDEKKCHALELLNRSIKEHTKKMEFAKKLNMDKINKGYMEAKNKILNFKMREEISSLDIKNEAYEIFNSSQKEKNNKKNKRVLKL